MKYCFTYCGDDKCTCPAREAHDVLAYVSPALPLLETMLLKLDCARGAEVARGMRVEVARVRPLQSNTLERAP